MASVKKFEDLEIWQSSRAICMKINNLVRNQVFCKDFALVDQIKRSSSSVMGNIAEGFERDGRNEIIQFLSVAKGSADETRSQLYRAFDNQYVIEEEFNKLNEDLVHLSTQLQNMINYLKN